MGRMIHAAMWEDEFFTSMPQFDKLLWIGLITVCADDQGRFQDSAAMIRSKVFPVEDIPLTDINAGIARFKKDGKTAHYIAGKHKCVQIVNWWKHQKPQWAGKSIYPPCDGWVDRMRYHAAKNEIVNINWDQGGGFPDGYIDGYIDGKVKSDVKSDVKVEVEVKSEGEEEVDVAIYDNDSSLISEFESISKLQAPRDPEDWSISLQAMRNKGITNQIMSQAVSELSEKNYKITGPKSIEQACAIILAKHKREVSPRIDEFAEYVRH